MLVTQSPLKDHKNTKCSSLDLLTKTTKITKCCSLHLLSKTTKTTKCSSLNFLSKTSHLHDSVADSKVFVGHHKSSKLSIAGQRKHLLMGRFSGITYLLRDFWGNLDRKIFEKNTCMDCKGTGLSRKHKFTCSEATFSRANESNSSSAIMIDNI